MNKIIICFIIVFIFENKMTTSYGRNTTDNIVIEYNINPNIKYQIIDNFSASDAWRTDFIGKYWPLDKKNQIADLLFRKSFDSQGNPVGMGLSNWRVNIGAGSFENREYHEVKNSWNRTECFLSPDGKYNFDKQIGQQWFMKAAKDRGVNDFLFFCNSAPYFMTRSASTVSTDMDYINLQEDKFDDFAKFLVNCAGHFINQGYNIKYISPINEPNGEWSQNPNQEGSFATKADIYKVVYELDKAITNASIPTKIIIPEIGNMKYLFEADSIPKMPDNLIEDLFTRQGEYCVTKFKNLYQCIAAHDYWTTYPPKLLVEMRTKIRNAIKNIPLIKFWASEYCILEQNEEITMPPSPTRSINLGLYVARIIHHDLTIANASAWQWWTAISLGEDVPIQLLPLKDSSPESVKYDGIISPTKMLWSTANYSFFIRPGMYRIKISPTNIQIPELDAATSIMASSYTDGKQIISVFINYTQQDKKIKINCPNHKYAKMYTTSIDKNLKYDGIHKLSSITLPSKSIVTIVI